MLQVNSLAGLPASVDAPTYSRAALGGALVHIGAGNFNRSHMAVYLDELLRRGEDPAWAEVGVGLMPSDERLHDALASQDYLYGVLERDRDRSRYHVVGSLALHLYAPAEAEQVIAAMAASECKVVSLTVTEGGYFMDDVTGFCGGDPDIQRDVTHLAEPRTWLGFVAAAAERRMQSGSTGFTLLSCDNLQSNGTVARGALLAFAEMRGIALRRWLEANVSFPNSMVDRITPRASEDDQQEIAKSFGVLDRAPVVCEPFRQWVLEDEFIAGRPSWESVGVEITTDVAPYEKTKMRLLNGAHFTLAYPAAVMGTEWVSDAATDADIVQLFRRYQEAAISTLHDLPGVALTDYAATVVRRFANPALKDQVARICSEGTAKVAKFIIPVLADLQRGSPHVNTVAFVIATWLRYLDGVDDEGASYPIEDAVDTQARAPFAGPLAGEMRELFGDCVLRHPPFSKAVEEWLARIREQGMRTAIQDFNPQSTGYSR